MSLWRAGFGVELAAVEALISIFRLGWVIRQWFPGVFSAPPVPAKDSLRGVPTLPARRISFDLAQVITSWAETIRESSFHEAMILAFMFRAL